MNDENIFGGNLSNTFDSVIQLSLKETFLENDKKKNLSQLSMHSFIGFFFGV